jgi:hypothetical protein
MWSPSSSAPPTHRDDVRALIIEDYAIDNLYKKKCRCDFYEERIKKENSFDYYDQYTSTAPSNKKTRNNSNKNKPPDATVTVQQFVVIATKPILQPLF